MASGSRPGEGNRGGGRKLKPLSIKNYTPPAERKQREQAEESMKKLADIEIDPPDYLDDIAKQVWLRILPEVKKLPLKFLDQSTFEQFCTFYSIYIQSSNDIKLNGIKSSDGNRKNASYQIMSDAAKNMRQCGSELGFNFSSRMAMLISKNDENKDDDNPFADGTLGEINV
ncbi:phage terminase small subunit P27 family [Sporolactobacillus shoreicorticis]|uniref:Phage terminase small subunit P27 family n=1 Tax=Sporolactobacillus shoreicorticis TaxID=1923877 RepID=A0ABW5S885_9BACL|nr:phage terminase small subunit P27 family [Sporolactobacillus shoreicorticis]MCO7126628.1 phage terminase small subunit P27 family [Sporolactobacillus shoreicorticis]